MSRAAITAAVVVLALAAPARGEPRSVRGVVRDPSGAPIAGAVVIAGAAVAISGADGSFVIAIAAAVEVVAIDAPGAAPVTVAVADLAGRASIEVVVDTAAEVTTDADRDRLTQEIIEVIDVAPVAPGSTRILAGAARRVPGASSDPLKAVQSLPGVARVGPGSDAVVVWGAGAGDTRVFVDGVPVPRLYHAGGWRSVIAAERVDTVTVRPAAFGVERGGAQGAVVEVSTLALAEAPVLAIAADTLDGSAFARTRVGRVQVAAAARASWLDRVVEAVDDSDRIAGLAPVPRWADAQLAAEIGLGRGRRLRATVVAAGDTLDVPAPAIRPGSGDRERQRRGFVRAAASYRHDLADGMAEALVWAGVDGSEHQLRFASAGAGLDRRTLTGGGRGVHRALLAPWLAVSVGLDVAAERAVLERHGSLSIPAREGDVAIVGRPPGDDVAVDGWTAISVNAAPLGHLELIGRRVAVSLGLRADTWLVAASRLTPRFGDVPGIGVQRMVAVPSPRASVVVRIADEWAATAEAGRYSQARDAADTSAVFGNPGLGVEQAWHATVGASWARAPGRVEAVAFGRWLGDQVARDPAPTPPLAAALTQDGSGRVVGAQLVARLAAWHGLSGWLAYTASRSTRRDAAGERERLFDHDQTHHLGLAMSWDRGPWSAGLRLRWATGAPRTEVVGAFFDARSGRFQPITGAVNGIRLPDVVQLDVRAERRLRTAAGRLDLYLEIQNATGRGNAEDIAYSADYADRAYITGLPLVGVIGVRLER